MENVEITKNKQILQARGITCLRCDYTWNYFGRLSSDSLKIKNRCRCPKCHSSQNNFNREIFGRFVGL